MRSESLAAIVAALAVFCLTYYIGCLCYAVAFGKKMRRKLKHYEITLEMISQTNIHAQPDSVFATEAQAMKSWATNALVMHKSVGPRMRSRWRWLDKLKSNRQDSGASSP